MVAHVGRVHRVDLGKVVHVLEEDCKENVVRLSLFIIAGFHESFIRTGSLDNFGQIAAGGDQDSLEILENLFSLLFYTTCGVLSVSANENPAFSCAVFASRGCNLPGTISMLLGSRGMHPEAKT